jgi:Tol biopolymer transport system component
MIGKSLSQYEIVELIGEGGMGQVYWARDTKLGRDVAIKMLPADFAQNTERLARFEQEARTVGSLNHPGLVTLYELGQYENAPYMVMELVDGETLREKLGTPEAASTPDGSGSSPSLAPSPGLPTRRAVELAIQIARGLGAAHEQGVVHRDLKPENVLITPDGRAKILDFGLAKLSDSAAGDSDMASTQAMKTEPGKVMGTVGYMSPEQVRGAEVDTRTDIFSLGVMLYEMIAGQRAFQADTSVETMSAILNQDPPALKSATAMHLSPAIERIVRRCLEKEPAQRFQSANDLAHALDAIQDETSAAQPALSAAAKSSRSAPVGWIALAVVLAIAGFFLGRSRTGASDPTMRIAASRITQLTFENTQKGRPQLSPDGRSFVYVAGGNGPGEIFLRRIGGENLQNLTNTPDDHETQPAFSPDGEQIAFVRRGETGGIFLMGATGESVRRLTDFGFNPAWSPDGSKIVFGTELINDPRGRASISELWTVDVKTGALEKIYDGDAVEPAWSPDGSRIAFWGLPQGLGDRLIYTIPASGGKATYVTGDNSFSWNPVWADDGASLVFSSTRGGPMDLWRIPIGKDGGAAGPATPITSSTEWLAEPDLSTSGDQIICVARRAEFSLVRTSLEDGRREPLMETSRSIAYFSLSSDNELLTLAASDPFEDIYVGRPDGSALRRLTKDQYKDRQPSFSPDGQHIYFFSDRSGRYEIWRIRPDGSGLEQITQIEERDNVANPRLAPDGRKLAVTSTSDGCGIVDLTGSFPVTSIEWISPPTGDAVVYIQAWSPDGTEVFGQTREGQGWRLSLTDLEWTPTASLPGVPTWYDDQRVLVVRDGSYGVENPWTGESETTGVEIAPGTGMFLCSADSRWVYSLEYAAAADIWLLDFSEEE